jgi:hypothetical protein
VKALNDSVMKTFVDRRACETIRNRGEKSCERFIEQTILAGLAELRGITRKLREVHARVEVRLLVAGDYEEAGGI